MTPSSADKCQRGQEPVVREDGSIEIPLTQGQVAVVDAATYEFVSHKLWYALWDPDTRSFRAISNLPMVGGKQGNTTMHRVVMRDPREQVDHINHDTLDNRMANLRVATTAENSRNTRVPRNNTSGFKGVHRCKDKNRWAAYITTDRKRRHLGYYRTAEDAARAYDRAALELHGEFALTNKEAS